MLKKPEKRATAVLMVAPRAQLRRVGRRVGPDRNQIATKSLTCNRCKPQNLWREDDMFIGYRDKTIFGFKGKLRMCKMRWIKIILGRSNRLGYDMGPTNLYNWVSTYMITILSQSHTNYMATFTNFTNFTILHRHTWAWVKLGRVASWVVSSGGMEYGWTFWDNPSGSKNSQRSISLGTNEKFEQQFYWDVATTIQWLIVGTWRLVSGCPEWFGPWWLIMLRPMVNWWLGYWGCWDSKPPWDCTWQYLTQNTHGFVRKDPVSSGKIICTWCHFGSLWSPLFTTDVGSLTLKSNERLQKARVSCPHWTLD